MKKFNMLRQNELKYSAFKRVTKKKSKNGVPFWMYRLTRVLSDEEQKALLEKYGNIAFGLDICKYAPEIKFTTLLQFDKNIN